MKMRRETGGKVDPRLLAFIGVALAGVLIGFLFYFMTPEDERVRIQEEKPTGELQSP